jgi:extradiol dioxygenase family protein
MQNIRPFHLAFPVDDLEKAHAFYTEVLGCSLGRSSDKWIDFNLFGHQIVAHYSPEDVVEKKTNKVDGKNVPTAHWGVILEMEDWKTLAENLKGKGIEFIIEPYIRFEGEAGEQATMFFLDPSGNALEFKAFKHDSAIFEV